MQVFVIRGDLLIEDASNPVRVKSTYSSAMVLPIDFHGPQCTLLTVADNFVFNDKPNFQTILLAAWRDDYASVMNAEAGRRIGLVFPDYKQRNYSAHYQDDITQYGADATLWPQQELDFKAEYDRGWKYVSDIRSASNAWTAMPPDPTADSIWPPTITPIK